MRLFPVAILLTWTTTALAVSPDNDRIVGYPVGVQHVASAGCDYYETESLVYPETRFEIVVGSFVQDTVVVLGASMSEWLTLQDVEWVEYGATGKVVAAGDIADEPTPEPEPEPEPEFKPTPEPEVTCIVEQDLNSVEITGACDSITITPTQP